MQIRGPKTVLAEKNIQDMKTGLERCRSNNSHGYQQLSNLQDDYKARQSSLVFKRHQAGTIRSYLLGEIELRQVPESERVLPKLTIAEKRKLLGNIKTENSAFSNFANLVIITLMLLEIAPLLLKWILSDYVNEYEEKEFATSG